MHVTDGLNGKNIEHREKHNNNRQFSNLIQLKLALHVILLDCTVMHCTIVVLYCTVCVLNYPVLCRSCILTSDQMIIVLPGLGWAGSGWAGLGWAWLGWHHATMAPDSQDTIITMISTHIYTYLHISTHESTVCNDEGNVECVVCSLMRQTPTLSTVTTICINNFKYFSCINI